MGGDVVVPIIDMNGKEVGENLVKACQEIGCFRVVNHGVPLTLIQEMKAVVASLLDLPVDIKRKIPNDPIEGYGYTPPNSSIGSFFETMALSDVASPDRLEQFLDQLHATPHQRETMEKYSKAVYGLAQGVICKLLKTLGLEGEYFNGWPCQFRLNKYKYGPEDVGSLGIKLHTDPGFLTFLQDDETIGGFHLIHPKTQELVPSDPIAGSFIVNVGDVGKVWSNGRFCNVKHQVNCYKAGVRISFGLFLLGPKIEKLEAPQGLVDSTHPRLYVPFNLRDYKEVRISSKAITGEALEKFRNNETEII